MKTLLLASSNTGKLKEMQALLDNLDIQLVSPVQAGIHIDVEEHGETYAENASLKALAFSKESGLVTVADDSGLEVDWLDGKPGVHSHRFLPQPNASDADRRKYLIELLSHKPRPWLAHFHCTVALAAPDGRLDLTEGDCFGEIIAEERGSNGFGYDPIFFIRQIGKTMAELTMEEKNRISHRARAIQSARPLILKAFDAF